MSNQEHPTETTHKEHGTLTSYVVGFILSIILTLDPYYLVTQKVLHGNALLLTILIFAVLQLAVQLIFFLHLGRGPKPLYNIVFFFATAGIIVVTVGASIFIMNNLYQGMSEAEVTQKLAQDESIAQVGGTQTGACQELKTNHQITIKNGIASPSFIQAERCDTMSVINEDPKDVEVVYGANPLRISYGGENGLVARSGKATVVTLNQIGSFSFYNAQNPGTAASFTVTP